MFADKINICKKREKYDKYASVLSEFIQFRDLEKLSFMPTSSEKKLFDIRVPCLFVIEERNNSISIIIRSLFSVSRERETFKCSWCTENKYKVM